MRTSTLINKPYDNLHYLNVTCKKFTAGTHSSAATYVHNICIRTAAFLHLIFNRIIARSDLRFF